MSPRSLRSGFLFLLFLLQVTLLAQQAVPQSIGGTFFETLHAPLNAGLISMNCSWT